MLDSILTGDMTLAAFLILTFSSLALGVLNALTFLYRSRHTASLALALALLPAAVQMVIMMVNGSVGVGVAVAGAFGLVRFRSAPGSARDIAGIFVAMALGLATGMGYLGLAALFLVIVALATLVLTRINFGGADPCERELKITIPENLDYETLFDDLFEKYAVRAELERVKTTNMGTLYELTYRVLSADGRVKKAFLDEIRCRNGNLNIVCGRPAEKNLL